MQSIGVDAYLGWVADDSKPRQQDSQSDPLIVHSYGLQPSWLEELLKFWPHFYRVCAGLFQLWCGVE